MLSRITFAVQDWLHSAWSISDLSQKLQIIGLVVNSILTSILVLATLAYVWLTHSTVTELVEARRAAKRPVLDVQLCELQFDASSTEYILMICAVRMVNVGSAALFPAGRIALPYAAPPNSRKDWLDESITTDLSGLPEIIPTGQHILSEVKLPVTQYVISEGRIPEFCELHLKFEDSERNLYELRQRFDLFHHGKRYLLTLKYEVLSMLPFRKRRFIGDDSLKSRYSEDDKNWELLYQRVGFL
jgi:hypothetical protein